MRHYALLVLITMAPLSIARADDCANVTGQATMDIYAAADAQKSDAELNALYKQIRQRLRSDAATTKLLVHSQQAWVAFRDAECDFSASGSAGGTVYPMILDMYRRADPAAHQGFQALPQLQGGRHELPGSRKLSGDWPAFPTPLDLYPKSGMA